MINIKKFRHTAIIVQNLDKMKRFYTETLGLKCIRSIQISSEDFQRGSRYTRGLR
jgi:catechol 2,3-dioxygenase-like lactoylglutathione lyase family enzyme